MHTGHREWGITWELGRPIARDPPSQTRRPEGRGEGRRRRSGCGIWSVAGAGVGKAETAGPHTPHEGVRHGSRGQSWPPLQALASRTLPTW